MFHLNYIIEDEGALVDPNIKHQYRNKGDNSCKMICSVP